MISSAVSNVTSARALLVGLLALSVWHAPIFAEEVISSDELIEKLAMPPPVRTRGLVKTTGPDIGNSANTAAGTEMVAGSVILKIQFAHDSSELSTVSQAQLNELGKALNARRLLVHGSVTEVGQAT